MGFNGLNGKRGRDSNRRGLSATLLLFLGRANFFFFGRPSGRKVASKSIVRAVSCC